MKQVLEFETIDQFGEQQLDQTLEFSAEEVDRPAEVAQMGPVRIVVAGRAGAVKGEYELEGKVSFTADLLCSRCLEPYPVASESPFHIRYAPRSAAPSDEELEREITGEELELEFFTEPLVSLRELALEQVQLSLPMKPLCGETCAGLCPHCGANRNRGGCDCGEKAGDDRWSALRGFREQLVKKNEN